MGAWRPGWKAPSGPGGAGLSAQGQGFTRHYLQVKPCKCRKWYCGPLRPEFQSRILDNPAAQVATIHLGFRPCKSAVGIGPGVASDPRHLTQKNLNQLGPGPVPVCPVLGGVVYDCVGHSSLAPQTINAGGSDVDVGRCEA